MRNGILATAAIGIVYLLLAAGIVPAWLTGNVSGIGLIVVPAGLAAAALVTFFSWRSGLRRRFVPEVDDLPRAA